MAAIISEQLMEETWQRVAASTPAHAVRLQEKCGLEQQELAGIVIGFTVELRPDVCALALYLHVVISESFRQSGVKLRRIKPGKIMRTWELSHAFVEYLKLQDPSNLSQAIESTTEPAVFSYVLDALSEDQDDPVVLDDAEFWHIVRVLKTVTDCLHDAQK